MPFKTMPKIIRGQGNVDQLKGKEVLAHLMLDIEKASDIDKYKFTINSKLYTYILYKKLIEMPKAIGWQWKKSAKVKKDKYDKLIDEYLPLLSQETLTPIHEVKASGYDKIAREMMNDDKLREEIILKMIDFKDIHGTKKIDRYKKKYDIVIKQKTLW